MEYYKWVRIYHASERCRLKGFPQEVDGESQYVLFLNKHGEGNGLEKLISTNYE